MNQALRGEGGARVGWRGLLLSLALLALFSAAAGAGAAYWVLQRYTLHMPLQAQRVEVRLPEVLPVEVEVMPQDPAAAEDVALQSFPVRVNDTFRTVVRVDTRVPIRMSVPFRGEVPVNLDLPLNTRVKTRVLGIPLEVPVQGEIPLHFSLPVDLVIPIEQSVPMKFDLPVNTRIDQIVNIKVQAQQAARIRLRESSLPVTLQAGKITVPLSWLSLVAPEDTGPLRRLGPLAEPPPELK